MALRLEELETFLAVNEQGGFAAAARQLGLSASAVSKHVSSLERVLGTRLMQRTTRSLSLTEAGRELRARAPRLLEHARQLEADLRGEARRPTGRLRVAAPQDFARLHLCSRIQTFLRRYPQLDIDLELGDRQVAVVDEGFDVVLRIAATADSGLIRRRLVACPSVLCAAPAYLEERGEPERVSDLAEHACLVYAHTDGWRLLDGGRSRIFRPTPRDRSNSGMVLRDLLVSGRGIGLLPTFLIADDLRAGRLVALLPGAVEQDLELMALYPHRQGLPAKVRVFVDFLVEEFGVGPGELAPWDHGLSGA